ncbi:hypothetical protein BDV11DRAFT_178136 [Aspergillus similis]
MDCDLETFYSASSLDSLRPQTRSTVQVDRRTVDTLNLKSRQIKEAPTARVPGRSQVTTWIVEPWQPLRLRTGIRPWSGKVWSGLVRFGLEISRSSTVGGEYVVIDGCGSGGGGGGDERGKAALYTPYSEYRLRAWHCRCSVAVRSRAEQAVD